MLEKKILCVVIEDNKCLYFIAEGNFVHKKGWQFYNKSEYELFVVMQLDMILALRCSFSQCIYELKLFSFCRTWVICYAKFADKDSYSTFIGFLLQDFGDDQRE